MKNIIATYIFIFIIIAFSCCKKFNPDKITLEEAKNTLPLYYYFLDHLIKEGYEFWDFHKFWISDKDMLPEKLIVLRHDIHEWDIKEAYFTYIIENELLSGEAGTYYVRLDDPKEMNRLGNEKYEELRKRYIEIIDFLKRKNVDIQPHISPCDMYVYDQNPAWKNISSDSLKSIVNNNYQFTYSTRGLIIQSINIDVLEIQQMNSKLAELLSDYNNNWLQNTGLKVESYAAHGSDIALNLALGNVRLLNQTYLLHTGLYKFETTSNIIRAHLEFIHDTYRPEWIENPWMIEPGIYELLIHPDIWEDPQSWRDEYGELY